MKLENERNENVRQLLDSLEEHGKNAHRQKKLGELIDRLAEEEKTVEQPHEHRKLVPLWLALGAAAACLLLWLLVKPNAKQQPEMEQEILVETKKTVDSVKTEEKKIVIKAPVLVEELLAEETTIVPQKTQMIKEKTREETIEETVEQPILAEVTLVEPTDTTNIGSNTIPAESETPSSGQKPKRRVIQSLNLVCYECQREPEFITKPGLENRTLFGQPQDPNMKNGALAFDIKLKQTFEK